MIALGCFEEFLESFSNTNLKKVLQLFKEVMLVDEWTAPVQVDQLSVLEWRLEEMNSKLTSFQKSVEECLLVVYYVNNSIFSIEDFARSTKDISRKIFSVVLKKVHLILHENVKRSFANESAKLHNKTALVLSIELVKSFEQRLVSFLRLLATVLPNQHVLVLDLVSSFEGLNDSVYHKSAALYHNKLRELFTGLQSALVDSIMSLESSQTYNIDEKKRTIQRHLSLLKLIRVKKSSVVVEFEWVLGEAWNRIHALIGKVYSENHSKQLIKKLTNVCWNCYNLIHFLEIWIYEHLANRNWQDELAAEVLRKFVDNLDTNKEFLSRKIFENLNCHFVSLPSADKKESFLSYFVDGEKRKLFKNIGLNIKEKKIEDDYLLVAGLLARKHGDLFRALVNEERSMENLRRVLEGGQASKYLVYLT